MMSSRKFFVPSGIEQFKYKEKGSLFLSQIFPVDSVAKANEILTDIKKKYFDATHNCYAYKIFPDNFKYSDDGEPKGSAGIRIYNAIIHYNLFNTLIIVTRYFGGTKLGIGPLGNAYYTSACNVIENSRLTEKYQYFSIKVSTDFSNSKTIYRFLQEIKAINIHSSYEKELTISAFIPIEMAEKLNSLNKQQDLYKLEFNLSEESYLF